MRANINGQIAQYGGLLNFPSVSTYPAVSIPLYIKEIDIPIRQPKMSEIATIGTIDESSWADGSTGVIFFGSLDPLTTQMSGFLITPTSPVTDGITGQVYRQFNPTVDGSFTGTTIGLPGYSYGDLIWAYIEGKIAQISPSSFLRVNPLSYIDPYGNQYNKPVIAEFTSAQTVTTHMQNFTMKLFLEV